MLLMIFGFFATVAFHAPWYVYVIGFLCAFFAPRWVLALFGIVLCIAFHATIGVWMVGFICLCLDIAVDVLLGD